MTRCLFILIYTFGIGVLGNAQTCCSAGAPLTSGIASLQSNTSELYLLLDLNHTGINRLVESNEVLVNDPRRRFVQNGILSMSYGLSQRFGVGLLVPMVRHNRTISTDIQNSVGLGDIFVNASYALIQNTDWHYSLSAAIKLPTGKIAHTDDRGIFLSPDMQSGTGTIDYLMSMSLGRNRLFGLPLDTRLNFTYRYNTTNPRFGETDFADGRSFRFGNEALIAVHFNYELLLDTWFVIPDLVLEYRNTSANIEQDVEAANSGGSWLSLTAGLYVLATEKFSQRVYVSTPFYQNLKGLQITTNFEVGLQLGYRIDFTKNKNPQIIIP